MLDADKGPLTAIRLLREQPDTAQGTRERNRVYDEAVRQALTLLWEAADRVCGKQLKALIPKLIDAMERHGHLDLDPVIRTKLLEVSAATIDRMLANACLQIDGQRKRRKDARQFTVTLRRQWQGLMFRLLVAPVEEAVAANCNAFVIQRMLSDACPPYA